MRVEYTKPEAPFILFLFYTCAITHLNLYEAYPLVRLILQVFVSFF